MQEIMWKSFVSTVLALAEMGPVSVGRDILFPHSQVAASLQYALQLSENW